MHLAAAGPSLFVEQGGRLRREERRSEPAMPFPSENSLNSHRGEGVKGEKRLKVGQVVSKLESLRSPEVSQYHLGIVSSN